MAERAKLPDMAEHAEKPDATSSEETAAPSKRSDVDWASAKDKFVSTLAAVVRWVCLIFALILVLHIVFHIAEANKDNGIVQFVSGWADGLTLGFGDLFQPEDDKLEILVNYGIAAVVWLVISSVGASLIRRVGGVGK